VVSLTLWPLYPWDKSSWYPLKSRLGKNKFITNNLDIIKTENVPDIALVIFREY
jgi:hypothetical protein